MRQLPLREVGRVHGAPRRSTAGLSAAGRGRCPPNLAPATSPTWLTKPLLSGALDRTRTCGLPLRRRLPIVKAMTWRALTCVSSAATAIWCRPVHAAGRSFGTRASTCGLAEAAPSARSDACQPTGPGASARPSAPTARSQPAMPGSLPRRSSHGSVGGHTLDADLDGWSIADRASSIDGRRIA